MTRPAAWSETACDMQNRIRQVRRGKGPQWTLEHVASRLGTTPKQLSRLERGERSLTLEWIERIARALDCDPLELICERSLRPVVPLVGYVGAGALYYPEPEHGPWVGFDEVEAPPSLTGAVAVIVRGSSMEPVYRAGEVLFFRPAAGFDPEQCLGRDCVVQVRAGPAYIKRLERKPRGTIRLVSYGAAPLDDVEVEWASPVAWVKRI